LEKGQTSFLDFADWNPAETSAAGQFSLPFGPEKAESHRNYEGFSSICLYYGQTEPVGQNP
jgi:hypothetical protein